MARKKKNAEAEEKIVVTDRASKLAAIAKLSEKMKDKDGNKIIKTMKDVDRTVQVISTRIPSFDIALSVGGIPRGRVIEFYGPERSGKTTAALQCAAVCQQAGGIIAYVDSEHSLDPEYCMNLGLDIEDPGFLLLQEETADCQFDAVIAMLDQGLIDLVVIDSLANLVPLASEEQRMAKGVGKALVGTKARLFTDFYEMAVSRLHKSNAAMLTLQQMRTIIKPGQQPREGSASPNSVKHNTSVRVKVSRVADDEATGNVSDETLKGISQQSKAKVEKNKVGPPFRQALYRIAYGKGALYFNNLVETCIAYGIPNVVVGGKYSIVTDDGEELCKFYPKKADDFLPDFPEACSYLVDKLSDAVGIHLYDPFRPERLVGPYTVDELEALKTSNVYIAEIDDTPLPVDLEILGEEEALAL